MDGFQSFDETFDFGSFINYPEENVESSATNDFMDFQFSSMNDFSAVPSSLSNMQLAPDMDLSQYDTGFGFSDAFGYPTSDSANESPLTESIDSFTPQADDFRYLVDSWASNDQRVRSIKQKRRDAAIDLHLQRFMNTHADSQLFPVDSDFSYSGTPSVTYSHESSQQSPVDSPPTSSVSRSDQAAGPKAGGCELVFDINLNTATQLPKKQKKRTKAQIEDYINARRNGACMKHKKQHKKCNCHEKLAAKTVDTNAKRRRAAVEKALVPASEFTTNVPSESPSTVSKSSFSPSLFSQVDSISFNDEIDSVLASFDGFDDLETWADLGTQSTVEFLPPGQYVPRESLVLSSTPNGSFNDLLGLRNHTSYGGSLDTRQSVATTGLLSGSAQVPLETTAPVPGVSPVSQTVPSSSLPVVSSAPVHPSTPVQQVQPTSSLPVSQSLPVETTAPVPHVSSLRHSVPTSSLRGSGLPMETTVSAPTSNLPVSGLPVEITAPVPKVSPVLQAVRTSSISPVSPTAGLPVQQVVPTDSVLKRLSIVVTSLAMQEMAELQATNVDNAVFKDVSQTALAHMAIQQFLGALTVYSSVTDWMSKLWTMVMQSTEPIPGLIQSNLFESAVEHRQNNGLIAASFIHEPYVRQYSAYPVALRV